MRWIKASLSQASRITRLCSGCGESPFLLGLKWKFHSLDEFTWAYEDSGQVWQEIHRIRLTQYCNSRTLSPHLHFKCFVLASFMLQHIFDLLAKHIGLPKSNLPDHRKAGVLAILVRLLCSAFPRKSSPNKNGYQVPRNEID